MVRVDLYTARDRVEEETNAVKMYFVSSVILAIPIAMFILGLMLVFNKNNAVFALGVIFLLISFAIIPFYFKKHRNKVKFGFAIPIILLGLGSMLYAIVGSQYSNSNRITGAICGLLLLFWGYKNIRKVRK